VTLEEPPRPVCPTGGEAKRRRVRPSVRPSVAVLQQFSSTRVSPFNKCYVGNASHRRLYCVVFSSSVQSIPKAVRATRPIIALIAILIHNLSTADY